MIDLHPSARAEDALYTFERQWRRVVDIDSVGTANELTDGIVLIEMVLKDEENLIQNLNRLKNMVSELKCIGLSYQLKEHILGYAPQPDGIRYCTPEEKEEIEYRVQNDFSYEQEHGRTK